LKSFVCRGQFGAAAFICFCSVSIGAVIPCLSLREDGVFTWPMACVTTIIPPPLEDLYFRVCSDRIGYPGGFSNHRLPLLNPPLQEAFIQVVVGLLSHSLTLVFRGAVLTFTVSSATMRIETLVHFVGFSAASTGSLGSLEHSNMVCWLAHSSVRSPSGMPIGALIVGSSRLIRCVPGYLNMHACVYFVRCFLSRHSCLAALC
jgi:hypothetical protein